MIIVRLSSAGCHQEGEYPQVHTCQGDHELNLQGILDPIEQVEDHTQRQSQHGESCRRAQPQRVATQVVLHDAKQVRMTHREGVNVVHDLEDNVHEGKSKNAGVVIVHGGQGGQNDALASPLAS